MAIAFDSSTNPKRIAEHVHVVIIPAGTICSGDIASAARTP